MTAREFRLWGKSELAHVRAKLESGLADWSARWFRNMAPPAITSLDTQVEGETIGLWFGLDTTAGKAWISLKSRDAVQLLAYWLANDSSHSQAATDETWTLHFVAGLFEEWLADSATAAVTANDRAARMEGQALPEALLAKYSGVISLQLQMGPHTLAFVLSPGYVKSLLKDMSALQPCARPPRVSTGDALTSATLRLRIGAWLQESISIDAVQGLAVGDVVLLGRRLDDPWPVTAPDGTTVGHCYLGRRETCQAIKLVPASRS